MTGQGRAEGRAEAQRQGRGRGRAEAHQYTTKVTQEGDPRHDDLPQHQQCPGVQLGWYVEEPKDASLCGACHAIVHNYEAKDDAGESYGALVRDLGGYTAQQQECFLVFQADTRYSESYLLVSSTENPMVHWWEILVAILHNSRSAFWFSGRHKLLWVLTRV